MRVYLELRFKIRNGSKLFPKKDKISKLKLDKMLSKSGTSACLYWKLSNEKV